MRSNANTFTSHLFDEKSFYTSFIKDLLNCQQEVIIESPFITTARMQKLYPIFETVLEQDVKIFVITKDPSILDEPLSSQSTEVIRQFEIMGIQVLATANNHHRKIAILDRRILWEGSLNILSQTNSREIMRRIEGEDHAQKMFKFLNLGQFI